MSSYCESTDPFVESRELVFGDTARRVTGVRFHKGAVLVSIEGIETPEAAQLLVGQLVKTDEARLPPKDEGEFYWHELVGMRVITVDGNDLGEITAIIPTGANDVLSVIGPRGEVLLPMIEDVVIEIDTERNVMRVDPLEGLIPDA